MHSNMNISAIWRRTLWKYWYPYLTSLTKDAAITFLNYGFVDDNPPQLQPDDERNRLYIQLYHHVAGALDLTNADVMEISCGHGGGASYVARYLHPQSMLGVDRNPNAIEFCRTLHTVASLSFTQGDAESLQFADGSFDAILNVEASHCYGDFTRFLREVTRLLRPGGHFLFADFRSQTDFGKLREEITQSGLQIVKQTEITPNVLRSMESDSQAKQLLIQQLAPRFLHKFAAQFAGVKGSGMFEGFASGETIYFSFVLQKAE